MAESNVTKGTSVAGDLGSPLITRLIQLAIEEDCSYGDITGQTSISEGHRSKARIIARERQVVCGLALAQRVASLASCEICWHSCAEEGCWVGADDVLLQGEGSTRDLLMVERVTLNFLQRMSGVATHTRQLVESSGALTILDTRKTMPGWRVLEKYATRVGGAKNHRMHLGEMILVKNNHIDACGSIDALFSRLHATKPWYMPVECEVRTLEELASVLKHRPQIVLLDNMSDGVIAQAMLLLRDAQYPVLVEFSGGLTKERLRVLSQYPGAAASLGSLTTQATNVDISMRIVPTEAKT